jgi:hypothetical protein
VLIGLDGQGPVEGVYDIVRDAVVELTLPLVRLEHRRHSLEDLFRDRPDEEPAVATA